MQEMVSAHIVHPHSLMAEIVNSLLEIHQNIVASVAIVEPCPGRSRLYT